MVISHLRKVADGTWELQSNESHQQGVAELASKFAGEFGLADFGRVLGLMHDLGKERRGVSAIHPQS